LVAQEVVDALGHTEEEIPAVAPTCTETGLTAGVKCSVCDEILEAQEVVDALGHTEEEIPAVDATCTETGLTAGVKCSVCGEVLTAQEVVDALGHTAGEATLETIDGVQVYVTRCTVCQEILETAEVGLADYTQLNALLEQANAIDVGNVYDMEQYEKMMAYIGNIDMNLPATQQSKVDNYVKTLAAYKMDRNLITYQLRTVNATATFEDGAVVLTVTEGKTQINLYQAAKNGDAITFNSTSGLSLSSSGVYYAKVNAIANITLANGKTVDVYFMIKDASEDVADYTAVDAAIEKAQAIVRDDVYDLETYDIMMEAVNKVQRGLPEREQATVTAYATEINAAYKNISLITSQLKVSYGKAEKFDDTIVCTLTRSDLSSRLLIYWSLRNGDEITFVRFGALRIAADGLRYATRTNTTAKIELKDGRQYLVLFVVKPLNENGYESVREQVERANAINTDDYYDMSEVNAFLDEIKWDLSEETDMVRINAYSVGLRDAIDRLRTIVSLLQTYNAPAVKDGNTITVTIIPGKSNVNIHPALKNGEPITITDLDGVIKASSGNYYSKYGGTATLTLQDGRSYNLVMDTNFVKEFTPQYVSLVNVDKYEYDADTQTFVLTANSSDIRIYKDAKAVALTVAADEYDFVSEYNLYYQIDSTKLHLADDSTARFTMESDDGKTINVVVIFPTLSILDFITMSNCSEKSFDAETNTAYIKLNPEATKRYVQIYNPALNGTEFTITSTSKYVQSNTSGYVLREAAVGADITIEFEGQTFTIVYTN
ncbi:MAG: hypothetical protein IIX39_07585, partial [Clostridia bacterium]|nr:hypothetical protein [Clostridia bacterium]